MPRIVKRVTPELKEKWQTFCHERGVSESDMLGLLLEKVTAGIVPNEAKGLEEGRLAMSPALMLTIDPVRSLFWALP